MGGTYDQLNVLRTDMSDVMDAEFELNADYKTKAML